MYDDIELIYSPLQQTIKESAKAINIQIYRTLDSGWTLEVVDENGNSTIWDAEFDTDQDALDQVMSEIKEDGIDAVIGPKTD